VNYRQPRLPSQDDVASVVSWLMEKGLLAQEPSPAALVDGRPLAMAASGW